MQPQPLLPQIGVMMFVITCVDTCHNPWLQISWTIACYASFAISGRLMDVRAARRAAAKEKEDE